MASKGLGGGPFVKGKGAFPVVGAGLNPTDPSKSVIPSLSARREPQSNCRLVSKRYSTQSFDLNGSSSPLVSGDIAVDRRLVLAIRHDDLGSEAMGLNRFFEILPFGVLFVDEATRGLITEKKTA